MQRRPFVDADRLVSATSPDVAKAARCYPRGGRLKPGWAEIHPVVTDGLAAGAVAGVLSGLPSTVHALVTGGDPLAAARAAGTLLLPAEAAPPSLLAAAGVVHGVISLGWGTVLSVAVRRLSLPPVIAGAAAGAVIAAVDLGLVAHGPVGRRWPLIRALPVWPQVADHLAFGAVAGAVLGRRA